MKRSKFTIKKGFIVQEVPEGIVIFDAAESKLYTFNETASIIFQNLKSQSSEKAIVKKLVEEYDINEPKATTEVKSFIEKLTELGFIE